MSLESVRAFLAERAPDLEIVEKSTSTATVAEAAEAHGVRPGQIAKTLSFWLKDEVVLLVLGGDARIDNQKFKARFKTKARMLSGNEVVEWTLSNDLAAGGARIHLGVIVTSQTNGGVNYWKRGSAAPKLVVDFE